MNRYLIDRDGDVTPAFDEGLVAKFGYPMPDFDLPSYAVRNLGAVDVTIRTDGASIRFRWLTVSRPALEAVIRLLIENQVNAVTFHCESGEWTQHSFPTLNDAIEWLETQASQRLAGGRPTRRHTVTTARNLRSIADRNLNQLEQSDDHFSFLFKKWRLARGTFSSQITETLVRFGYVDRAVIARERDDGEIVFEHVGHAITLYNEADDGWTFSFAGRPVKDQPDTEYGAYTEASFRDALTKAEPKFDHVDAVVHNGRGAGRFRYDRLLLPWELSSGGRVVTSLSFKTSPDSRTDA